MSTLKSVFAITEELMELKSKLEEMSDAWNGDDECERACNDPGLQYEVEMEIDTKLKELRDLLIEKVK